MIFIYLNMRLFLALAAAQSVGLFLTPSDAFCPASLLTNNKRSVTLNVGSWDNDEFLESLSSNNKNNAGDNDDLPEKETPGDELTEEQRKKISEMNDQEEYQGGTRLKQIMEAAKKAQTEGGNSMTPVQNPFAENPFEGIEGLDPQATPSPAPGNLNLNEMTVEQQAEMFRQMMQGNMQPPPVQAAPDVAIPPLPRPPAPDRKVGRNRDADAIQNTADVYFAQLKRDSTVRGIARIRGDYDQSNEVFADPKIKELENMIQENPHLKGARDKEKALIEAAQEDLLALQREMEKNRDNIETSGISYKQKLAERRKQKPGGASAAPAESKPQEAQAAPASAPVEPRMEAPPASAAALEPFQQQTQPAAEQYQQVQASQSQQYTPSNSVTADSSPEEIRTSIRTLMGLIIKHRGGPGFGAGGLKENDIAQYEKLVDEVTALLKKETQLNTANQAAAPQAAAPTQTDSANPMYSSAPPATSSTPEGQTAGLVTVPNSPSGGAQVESMLACIEGAILMYRNSPPELKDEVLMQIRAALLSAVNTCNKIMGQHEGIPSSTQGAGTQVDSMFACVEGAMLMYRNSPEELKQGVLMTLRAALLSALNTCNRIIAENEVDNYNQYKDATAGMEKPPITNRPTQFYNVERVEETQSAPSGKDENYKALDAIYSKLEATAGNGKLGLRENLTPEEASDLADSIVELRSILMDELDNGIPQEGAPGHQNSAAFAQSSQSASSSGSSTTSRYQEMLAKAREEKASNN